MEPKTALIAGASGLIGQSLIQELLRSERYNKVVALVRRPLGFEHDKLEQVMIDFNALETMTGFPKGHDVFCCLGTTQKKTPRPEDYRKVDYDYCISLAKRALKEGAERFFLISSLGAKLGSKNFYLNLKGELEHSLSFLNYQTLYIFRPALLLGNRTEHRPGEKWAQFFARIIPFVGPLKKYQPIHADKVVDAMLKVAQQDDKGCYFYSSELMQRM